MKTPTMTRSSNLSTAAATVNPPIPPSEESTVLPTLDTLVAIVVRGIAGAWTAFRLAQKSIPAVLITNQSSDSGGTQGAMIRLVGAVNTIPIEETDFHAKLKSVCQGQSNASIGRLMHERLAGELKDLNEISELESIKIGVAYPDERYWSRVVVLDSHTLRNTPFNLRRRILDLAKKPIKIFEQTLGNAETSLSIDFGLENGTPGGRYSVTTALENYK